MSGFGGQEDNEKAKRGGDPLFGLLNLLLVFRDMCLVSRDSWAGRGSNPGPSA